VETKEAEALEVLDLRRQLDILSGGKLSDRHYDANYDSTLRDGNEKPGLLTQRVPHQQIKPHLIIKEKNIQIDKVVGESPIAVETQVLDLEGQSSHGLALGGMQARVALRRCGRGPTTAAPWPSSASTRTTRT
jgi:hypothetical protein